MKVSALKYFSKSRSSTFMWKAITGSPRNVPMRHRRLKRLWTSLYALRNRKNITLDDLLMHLGSLKKESWRDFRLVRISLLNSKEPVNEHPFHFKPDLERLRRACDVKDSICFVPTCRPLHLKPSGNLVCF